MKRLMIFCALLMLLLAQTACRSAEVKTPPQPGVKVPVLIQPEHKPAFSGPSSDDLKIMLVTELIRQLGADDFNAREKASEELVSACELMGESSLALVKSALSNTGDAEVRMRLERALSVLNYCFGNIIINPSFEDGFNGWKCVENWNGSKIKLVTAEAGEAPDGHHYIEMWHDPAQGAAMWSSSWSACGQEIRGRLKPGVLYEIRFWYKTSHAYPFRMVISDAELTMHSSLGVSVGAPEADGKWHEVVGTIKATQAQLSYEPFLTLYYDYMAPGVIWFDRVSVQKVAAPAEKDK